VVEHDLAKVETGVRFSYAAQKTKMRSVFRCGVGESNGEGGRGNGSFTVAEISEALKIEGFLRRSKATSEIAERLLRRTNKER